MPGLSNLSRCAKQSTKPFIISRTQEYRHHQRYSRFIMFGPTSRKNVRQWCWACMECQRSVITWHDNKAPVGAFANPDARFHHVHIYLNGPKPKCQGFTYLQTMVDCFSRWPEAVPIIDISAEIVTKAFLTWWIAVFGVPAIDTTGCGSKFESALFQSLTNLLGTTQTCSTAYYPAINGMVGRMHRTLK